jgi:hypothetical protein
MYGEPNLQMVSFSAFLIYAAAPFCPRGKNARVRIERVKPRGEVQFDATERFYATNQILLETQKGIVSSGSQPLRPFCYFWRPLP